MGFFMEDWDWTSYIFNYDDENHNGTEDSDIDSWH